MRKGQCSSRPAIQESSALQAQRTGYRRFFAGAERAGSQPSTACCPGRPPRGPPARHPKARSVAVHRKSNGSSGDLFEPSPGLISSVNGQSGSTVTLSKRMEAPAPPRSPAASSRLCSHSKSSVRPEPCRPSRWTTTLQPLASGSSAGCQWLTSHTRKIRRPTST